MIDEKILLEQEHKATGFKVLLTYMEDSHIKHLIKLAQDESLINLLAWNTFFEADDREQFIETISDFTLPYLSKKLTSHIWSLLNSRKFTHRIFTIKRL